MLEVFTNGFMSFRLMYVSDISLRVKEKPICKQHIFSSLWPTNFICNVSFGVLFVTTLKYASNKTNSKPGHSSQWLSHTFRIFVCDLWEGYFNFLLRYYKKKKKAVWETRCAVVLQEYYLSICGKLFIEQLSF